MEPLFVAKKYFIYLALIYLYGTYFPNVENVLNYAEHFFTVIVYIFVVDL